MAKYKQAKAISQACSKLIESMLTAGCKIKSKHNVLCFLFGNVQLDCYPLDGEYVLSIANESLTLCKEDDEQAELGRFFLVYKDNADVRLLIEANAPELDKARLC